MLIILIGSRVRDAMSLFCGRDAMSLLCGRDAMSLLCGCDLCGCDVYMYMNEYGVYSKKVLLARFAFAQAEDCSVLAEKRLRDDLVELAS